MSTGDAEWSVLDSRIPVHCLDQININLPKPSGKKCLATDSRDRHGFVCTRVADHSGRHAATLSDGSLAAVWKP
jgi:hypothetical protein